MEIDSERIERWSREANGNAMEHGFYEEDDSEEGWQVKPLFTMK